MHQQLYHLLFESYIDQKQNQIQMQWNKYQHLYYTFLEYYSNRVQSLVHEHNYQQLHNTFLIVVVVRNKL